VHSTLFIDVVKHKATMITHGETEAWLPRGTGERGRPPAADSGTIAADQRRRRM